MARSSRGVLQSALLLPLLVYLLLPYFGTVWHDVVPEHDHLFLGPATAQDSIAHDDPAFADDLCAVCRSLAPGASTIHAFNPASALQAFGIVVGLAALLLIVAPRGPWTRLFVPAPFLRSPLLAPLDPPPAF